LSTSTSGKVKTATTTKSLGAELVIDVTAMWILQNLICFIHLLEFLGREWIIAVFVGVALAGFLLIGFLDLLVTGTWRNTEQIIQFGVDYHRRGD
jgi:uncharacterized membrane protein